MSPLVHRPLPPLLHWAGDILRGWSWTMSGLALLVGAVTLVAMGTPLAPSIGERKYIIPLLYNVLQFGFPLVFAVQLSDHAVDKGVRPLWAYAVAVFGVALIGTWPIARALWPLLGKEPYWDIGNDLWLVFNAVLYHALGVAAYAQWRGERVVRERLQASELERAAKQRLLTTARLLALQARVEPQLLFDTLGHIDRALVDEGDAADRRLADLIDLLRAMQSAAHVSASTLGREVALIEAYARVSAEVGMQPGWLNFDVSAEAAATQFAPLVLLPLLRAVTALPTWRWQVSATRVATHLRITVTAPAAGATSFAAALQAIAIDELRQRLQAVHGAHARLQVDSDGEPRVRIELEAHDDAHSDR